MPTIAAVIASAAEHDRVQVALRRWGAVDVRGRGGELDELVRARNAVRVIVAEPRDADGAPTAPVLRALREWDPSVRILLYTSATPADLREATAFAAETGIAAVVIRGVDDLASAVAAALADARVQDAAEQILQAIAPSIPDVLMPALAGWARHGPTPLLVDEAVAASGLSRRTLYALLTQWGFRPVEAVVGCFRVAHVARQLDLPRSTLADIKDLAGAPSVRAVQRMFARHVRLSPTEVRRRGGFGYVLAILPAVLRRPPRDDPGDA